MSLQEIDLGNGRTVFRFERPETAPARSDLPCPMVISDTIEPLQSMADGKYYSSKAAMRATYLPGGNPQGERYLEVGNDPQRFKTPARKAPDRKGIRESLKRAKAKHS